MRTEEIEFFVDHIDEALFNAVQETGHDWPTEALIQAARSLMFRIVPIIDWNQLEPVLEVEVLKRWGRTDSVTFH